MAKQNQYLYQIALNDFREARQKAALQELLGRLRGEANELLAYDDVRKKLRVTTTVQRGLQEIPLDKIVGSVGRYQDYTRDFLPKHDSDEHRWSKVKAAVSDLAGLPPIEVYQLGDAYFVIDGNHRVSVARQMDSPTISGFVTEVKTRVSLSASDDPETIIAKARYARFLEKTGLDELRPEADLHTNIHGKYRVLLQHIDEHQYFMGMDWQRDVNYEEAVAHWYDTVYLPVVQLIRERGALHAFPELTETDLYVLLAEHRAELAQSLGWEVDAETAVSDLAMQKSSQPQQVVSRVGSQLLDALLPDQLESGPQTGAWRSERVESRRDKRLFPDVLVAVRPISAEWQALDHAHQFVWRENGRLLGVTVVASEEERDAEWVTQTESLFIDYCRTVEANCRFAVEIAPVARAIVHRAAWADLVVAPMTYPLDSRPLARLDSGLQKLLNRCPRPVLAVPRGAPSELDCALLAFDGAPKAKEALFVAAYLAGCWQVALTVITVSKREDVEPPALAEARDYLESQEIGADYVHAVGAVAETVLKTAVDRGCNLLIMGGFSSQPVVQLMLGSSVEDVLRQAHIPVLICR